jgi:predicted nucleic acid-binding protein
VRRYLLDAGPLTALLQGRAGAVALMRPWVQNREAATSILAYGEAVEYLRPKPDFPAHLQALHELLEGVRPFFLTYPILRRYADLRLHLRPRGQLIGDVDTLIAATALERNLTVVTLDGDFGRIPSLAVLHLTKQQLN